MKLRDYIEAGAKKAGSLTALGKMLDLTQPQISTIKAEKKPLPDKQLVQLAEYLGVPEIELIRANNIAMGKHVDFWTTWGKAASLAALAFVTLFVTPTPAEAAQDKALERPSLYYVKSRMRKESKKTQLLRTVLRFIERRTEPVIAILQRWIAQPQAI